MSIAAVGIAAGPTTVLLYGAVAVVSIEHDKELELMNISFCFSYFNMDILVQ